MPVTWLRAHAKMLVRMEQDEMRTQSLVMSRAVAYAFGSMSKEAAGEYERWMSGGAQPKRSSASPREVAQMLGIPIVREPRKAR